MSKRVVRSISEGRLINPPRGKSRSFVPIGLDRFRKSKFDGLDLFKPRSAAKTKNLISYLLGHGYRAQRATLPKRYTRLRVLTPTGNRAVKLRFE